MTIEPIKQHEKKTAAGVASSLSPEALPEYALGHHR